VIFDQKKETSLKLADLIFLCNPVWMSTHSERRFPPSIH